MQALVVTLKPRHNSEEQAKTEILDKEVGMHTQGQTRITSTTN